MFPHMYKVRPPRQRKEEAPSSATPECEWQGDNWRKNSKWGPGSRDGQTPPTTPQAQVPPTPSFCAVPPALPAPPSDPQDNLTRRPSKSLQKRIPKTDQGMSNISNGSWETEQYENPSIYSDSIDDTLRNGTKHYGNSNSHQSEDILDDIIHINSVSNKISDETNTNCSDDKNRDMSDVILSQECENANSYWDDNTNGNGECVSGNWNGDINGDDSQKGDWINEAGQRVEDDDGNENRVYESDNWNGNINGDVLHNEDWLNRKGKYIENGDGYGHEVDEENEGENDVKGDNEDERHEEGEGDEENRDEEGEGDDEDEGEEEDEDDEEGEEEGEDESENDEENKDENQIIIEDYDLENDEETSYYMNNKLSVNTSLSKMSPNRSTETLKEPSPSPIPKSKSPSPAIFNAWSPVRGPTPEPIPKRRDRSRTPSIPSDAELPDFDGELTVDDWVESGVTFHSHSKQKPAEESSGPAFEMPVLKPIPAPPPPPPPPPGSLGPLAPAVGHVKPSSFISPKKKAHLESIKKAARTTRPDWHSIMTGIKGGFKLKKVPIDKKTDRSSPMLPSNRGKNGRFVYDSEIPNARNNLLRDIHRGVKLRRTVTNDRSKPDFKKLGIKKLRRQLTTEEKKQIDPNAPEALPSSSDEEEDIDKMRDDLLSTKNQLANEIQKNKKMERDAKIMQIDLEGYQAEIRVLKRKLKDAGVNEPKPMNTEPDKITPQLSKSMSRLKMGEDEPIDFEEIETIETEISALQDQIYAHRQKADMAERKTEEALQKLEIAKSDIEEWETRCNYFEKKYKQLQSEQTIELPEVDCHSTQYTIEDIMTSEDIAHSTRKSESRRSFSSQFSRMESFAEEDEGNEDEKDKDSEGEGNDEEEEADDEEEEEEEEDESEEESESESESDQLEEEEEEEPSEEVDGEDYDEDARAAREQAKQEKRLKRELELWKRKLNRIKDKESLVKEDRREIRERITKYHEDMLNERQQYLKVKTEVNEILNMLKDPNDEDDDDEEEEEEETNNYNDDDDGGWWLADEDEKPLKPKKLKKKKKKYFNAEGRLVEEEDDEDLSNLSALQAPVWYESEDDKSDTDNEEDDIGNRLVTLQLRTQTHEMCVGGMKKSNHLLKDQVKRCDEMYQKERRRHMRLNEELQKLLIDAEFN